MEAAVVGEDVTMTDDILVGNFLEHFGVKGMKWGVRNVDRSTGVTKKKANTPPKARKPIGNGDGKVSVDEAKAASVQVAKVALKYGAPSAAVAVGAAVGLPAVAALGVSVRILQDPGVQEAISVGARFAKDMAPDMSSIKVPSVDMPKLKNPFSVSSKVTDGGAPSKAKGTREWMIKDGAGYTPVQWPLDKGFPPSLDTIRDMQARGEIPK